MIVKIHECLTMPMDLIGEIAEKNSRIRQGLSVAGPHYFPGHNTSIFLRIYNLSGKQIRLQSGDNIAQIIFHKIEEPETPYSKQVNASFNDETDYTGLGKYETEYNSRMEEISEAEDDLKHKIDNIYANIIT